MSRSVVTGGAGFIGSHLVDALLERGDQVLVLDDLSAGRRSNLEGAGGGALRIAVGDISDPVFVLDEIRAYGPTRAFHLAAQADVRKAGADPAFDARVNVLGTINVLEALREAGAPPLVFASTGGAIYGEGEGRNLPFSESDRLAPESPYGASKLAGEIYLDLYRRVHRLPAVALRFANVYGPRQDPHGEAGVVAIFCGRLLNGEPPLIFGNGLQTRDYIHVDDVIKAMLAADAALEQRGASLAGPYNVGTGVETSVIDLLEQLLPLAGSTVAAEHAAARPGEIERVAIDPAAASTDLGWAPATALAEGLAGVFEWARGRGGANF